MWTAFINDIRDICFCLSTRNSIPYGKYFTPESIRITHSIARSTICMLGNFAFLSSADFLQNQLFRKIVSGIPSASNSLDPDQAQYNLGPDLCPNCLYRL